MENEIRAGLKSKMIELLNKIDNEEVGSVHYRALMGDLEVASKQWREAESIRKKEEEEESKSIVWRLLENGPLVQAGAGLLGVVVLVGAESFARIIIPSVAKSFVRFK